MHPQSICVRPLMRQIKFDTQIGMNFQRSMKEQNTYTYFYPACHCKYINRMLRVGIVLQLVTVSQFLPMKRDVKLTAIMWLLGQTLYDSWSNISCSSISFSSPPWCSTNSFHSTLHHSRLHICHFCLFFFSVSAGRDKWLSHAHLTSNLSEFCCYLYFVLWTKMCLSPSCDLSFSHHATRLSVLFWMTGFLVSSKFLHNSFRRFPFHHAIIHGVLDTKGRRNLVVGCSSLRDSKRPSSPESGVDSAE
jgi:hypothetical protein